MYKSRFLIRVIAILGIAVAFCTPTYSQEYDEIRVRKSSINIGFVNSTLKQEGFPDLKSNYGVSLTFSHSYYFWTLANDHLRFGLDISFCDLTYTNYRVEMKMFEGGVQKYGIHEAEFGLQAGLAIDYAINSKVGLHLTARYSPNYSLLHCDYNGLDVSETVGSFGNFFVGGLTVRYRRIGVGFEDRLGRAKYKNLFNFEEDEDYGYVPDKNSHIGATDDNGKIKSNIDGFRTYLTLYF